MLKRYVELVCIDWDILHWFEGDLDKYKYINKRWAGKDNDGKFYDLKSGKVIKDALKLIEQRKPEHSIRSLTRSLTLINCKECKNEILINADHVQHKNVRSFFWNDLHWRCLKTFLGSNKSDEKKYIGLWIITVIIGLLMLATVGYNIKCLLN